jgi:hypothetical protein
MNSGSKISANLGRRTRTGGNAHGWLWEITSRSTLAHVTIDKHGWPTSTPNDRTSP